MEVVRPDGTRRHAHARGAAQRGPDGQVVRLYGTLQDITERERAEEVLRKSEAELKEAQRIARLGNWVMDVKTGQTTWSNEVYRMLGLDPSLPPPPSQEHSRLFTPESWMLLTAAVDTAAHAGVPYELELETVRADGSRGWMMDRGESVRDADGAITHLRGVAMDITERRNLAEQFRQPRRWKPSDAWQVASRTISIIS